MYRGLRNSLRSYLVSVGRTTAYELVMRGTLQSVKVGRRRLLVREGIDRYVAELLAQQVNC
jgi:excisionase family DNA binding protein